MHVSFDVTMYEFLNVYFKKNQRRLRPVKMLVG